MYICTQQVLVGVVLVCCGLSARGSYWWNVAMGAVGCYGTSDLLMTGEVEERKEGGGGVGKKSLLWWMGWVCCDG